MNKKKLTNTIYYYIVIITSLTVFIIGFFWIYSEHTRNQREMRELYDQYIERSKQLVKLEAEKVYDYIEYKRSTSESRLKTELKDRVNEAITIINTIYNDNKTDRTEEEIKQLILDYFRPLRFNEGRGYYFIEDVSRPNSAIALALPGKEGEDRYNVKDVKGKYFIREMVQLIRDKGSGFVTYYRSLPEYDSEPQPKISYVELFEPFNWLIGTGEYINMIDARIQSEIRERVARIRFENDGYVFIYRGNGDQLVSDWKVNIGETNLWHKENIEGEKVIQRIIKTGLDAGKGFIEYKWEKITSDDVSDKISYVFGIPEWDWVIGTGVYLDEISGIISAKQKELALVNRRHIFQIMLILFCILISTSIVYRFTIDKIRHNFASLSKSFDKAVNTSARINKQELNYLEFEHLADTANNMISNIESAQNQIVQEKDLAQNYLDVAGVILMVLDNEARIKMINRKGCEVLGSTERELLGSNWLETFIPRSDRKTMKKYFQDLLSSGNSQIGSYENWIINAEGKKSLMRWQNTVLYDEDNNVIGTLSSGEDITFRRQAEERLKRSEKRLRQIIAAFPEGILILDRDKNILFASEQAGKLLNTNNKELFRKGFDYEIDEGENNQIRIESEDKSVKHLSLTAVRTDWEDKEAILVIISDISIQVNARKELEIQKAYFEQLFDSAPAAIALLDNNDRVITINSRFTELFGYTSDEVVTRKINDLVVPDEHKKNGLKATKDVARGNYIHFETVRRNKNGDLINVAITGRPIKIGEDQIAVYGMYQDISERKRAEQKLVESELQYRTIVESSGEGIGNVDSENRFTFANYAAARIFGFDHPEEILGRKLSDMTTQEGKRILNDQTGIRLEGKSSTYEIPIVRNDGRERILQVTASPIMINDGLSYALGIFKDITERAEYEKKLRDTRDFMEKILESVSNIVFTTDLQGKITNINKAGYVLSGYSEQEIIGAGIQEILKVEPFLDLEKILADISRKGKAYSNLEVNLQTRSGQQKILSMSLAPMLYDGVILSLVGAAEDITNRKQAQNALQESEQRFRNLFRSSPDAIFLADPETEVITDANPAAERLLNKTYEEIVGMHQSDLHPGRVKNFSDSKFKKILSTTRSKLTTLPYENVISRSDGKEVPVEIVATMLKINNRNIVLSTFRDITSRKEAQEKIISQREHLKLINKILRHDITNNLVSISGGVRMMKRDPDPRILSEVERSVGKSIELIRDMREFEEFMNNHKNLRVLDPSELIKDIISNFQDLKFELNGRGSVLADKGLKSVLINIINNAVIHGKAGKISIKIISQQKFCLISISNNGRHIPASVSDKIFNEGFKHGKSGNTGMGLYIARKTIESYGGTISFENIKPRGVSFTIRLRSV